MYRLLAFLILTFLIACQSKQKITNPEASKPLAVTSSAKSTTGKAKENITDWNCEEPSFSYTGEQLIFWCTFPGFIKQQQIFIKDLNSGDIKQVTFLNGRIKSPQIVKQDLIVFSSDTDRRKEALTLDQQIFESDSLFEVYMYDLKDDEMFQLSHNDYFDGSIEYLKHIDPKIVYVEKRQTDSFVITKNLVNHSEKITYKTSNKIQEISTNHNNTLLIVENVSGKKIVSVLKNEKEKITLPEMPLTKFNFMYLPDSQKIEYLEDINGKTSIKNYDLTNLCESTIYTFTSGKVTQLRKSPLDNQTYVWVEDNNGVKTIKMGTLATGTDSKCLKLSARNKKTLRL